MEFAVREHTFETIFFFADHGRIGSALQICLAKA